MQTPRTILITGCSDGSVGSELALAFRDAGWRVFATSRDTARLSRTSAAGIQSVQLDVTSASSIRDAVAHVSERTGGTLDVLINNAGRGYQMPVLDIDLDLAREVFELNVLSIIGVTRGFAPLLLESAGRPYGAPLVVNHTSLSGQVPGCTPFQGTYNSSKAAAASLTETMRLELAPFNIRVINLVSGSLKSAFHQNAAGQKTLPPESMYGFARDVVEKVMSGSDIEKNAADTALWSKQIVRDLDKPQPPICISRGPYTFMTWLASFFPITWLDGMVKGMVGLDVIEKRVREMGGPGKLKQS